MSTAHYTAWITIDASCLETGITDVTVMTDEIHGYTVEDKGTEVPIWVSAGKIAFYSETGVDHRGGHEQIIRCAEEILTENGWKLTKRTWEPVETGYIATVCPSVTAPAWAPDGCCV